MTINFLNHSEPLPFDPNSNAPRAFRHHDPDMMLGLEEFTQSAESLDPQPISDRQEILENIVNRYV